MARVLVLGGSIRGKKDNSSIISDAGTNADNLSDYITNIKRLTGNETSLSNSEIIAGAAIAGAKTAGGETEYIPLINLFPDRDRRVFDLKVGNDVEEMTKLDTLEVNLDILDQLLSKLEKADGVILSTPIYFGDRSSVANKFLQITSIRKLLRQKVFGMISVGAKRNGGQETTNIFSLFEALNQDAFVVGNGPPTSQYGGTAVGGKKGHVLDDEWGLKTAMGTGCKVAHVAEIYKSGMINKSNDQINICILIAIDTKERMLRDYIDKLTSKVQAEYPWVNITALELIDHSIYRCLGCNTCPQEKEVDGIQAHCIIKDPTDFLEVVRKALRKADGAIVAGLNILKADKMIFRYQVFTERMRYIRRNDFELTNLMMTGLCYNQFGAFMNPIHSLKVMTSYLRQNTIIHRPIEILEHEGQLLDTGLESLKSFCEATRTFKTGKQFTNSIEHIYEPHGEGSGYKK